MSIKKIFLTGFAVAAFASLAAAQSGQPNQSPGDGGMMERGERGKRGGEMGKGAMMRGRMGMMNFEKLNLTDAQKQRIQAIQDNAGNSREANKAQFEELGKLMRLKREGLLTTEQGTRLNALQVQMQTRMRTDMEKMRNDILAVLTADQKTLLEQGGREMRREGMPGRGGRPLPMNVLPPTAN